MVIAAPHDGFDWKTGRVASAVGRTLGLPVVVATGFRATRERRWFDVNRPFERTFSGSTCREFR